MDNNEFEKLDSVAENQEEAQNDEEIVSEEEVISEEVENEEVTETEEIIDENLADDSVEENADNDFSDEQSVEEIIEEKPAKKKVWKVLLIVLVAIVLIVAIACGAIYAIFGTDLYNKFGLNKSEYGSFPDLMRNTVIELTEKKSDNKYNNLGYANPSGNTVKDIAEQMGMSTKEFLEMYGLPEDMPDDTTESAAFYSIPMKVFVQMNYTDFATFKEFFGIPDETTPPVAKTIGDKLKEKFGKFEPQKIDEDTPWGVVEDEITLAKRFGEENLEEFKKEYEITFEITGETRYKEVRRIIDEKQMQQIAESEASQEAQDAETEPAAEAELAAEAEETAE